VVKEGSNYKLRWVTPGGEIDLCGHATLAAGYIITRFIDPELSEVTFSTKSSGLLKVAKKGELYEMDFPAYQLKKVEVTDAMTEAIGVKPIEAYMGRDLLCILGSKDEVRNLNPNLEKMKLLDGLLFHVTAKGSEFDCQDLLYLNSAAQRTLYAVQVIAI
jgi:PhzF family phenazine biosynthesis protein